MKLRQLNVRGRHGASDRRALRAGRLGLAAGGLAAVAALWAGVGLPGLKGLPGLHRGEPAARDFAVWETAGSRARSRVLEWAFAFPEIADLVARRSEGEAPAWNDPRPRPGAGTRGAGS